MTDNTNDDGDRLGGRHWTYGPGVSAGADRPGRWPERNDADGWYSSGADGAHQRHLDELAHTEDDDRADHDDATGVDDAAEDDGWLIVDLAAPDGVRPLTAVEYDELRDHPRAGLEPADAGGPARRVKEDTAAAIERAHQAVREATDAPVRRSQQLDNARRADLASTDSYACCREIGRDDDEQTAESDTAELGEAR
ncbi:hypothetical protein EV383_4252 [Pseudonocardia sediminis]|uniref:Uncharacterized protein n=1 Tax=Pseudonocardia sediminis TaxID=1397368 RepID=A0A4Q7V3R0_PSEST|nr:hypothetical protein [Pseudonocardia sediminis]RZT87333.1 hypothetical protein EV383_4252 [Pseudonocardia sediminis]